MSLHFWWDSTEWALPPWPPWPPDAAGFKNFCVAVFIPIALAAGTTVLFCFAVALINMALTVSSVINATLVMDFSRPGLESVDYSLQMTGIHLGGLAMSAVSGMIVASVGYRMFFVNQTLFACLMFPVSLILFRGSWIPGAGPDTSG